MKYWFVLCLSLTFCLSGVSQPDLKFKALSIKDGLTNNSINDVIKDTVGFIWIATDDGLNRYDGQEFKIFHHSDSSSKTISSNTVYCLFQSRRGELIAGTHNGICRYNPIDESFDHLILSGVRVKEIIQSEINYHLFLTTDKGLFELDEE